jgi:hypothetical protein
MLLSAFDVKSDIRSTIPVCVIFSAVLSICLSYILKLGSFSEVGGVKCVKRYRTTSGIGRAVREGRGTFGSSRHGRKCSRQAGLCGSYVGGDAVEG